MGSLIFDNLLRTDRAVALQGESRFAYLNRSGRPIAAKIRAMMDAWIAHYPPAARPELVARLRGSDVDHQSSFFELMLHELMRRRRVKIVELHPKLNHTSKRPDFLLETADGVRFILEALVVMGRSESEAAAQARIDEAINVVELTRSPHHRLMVRPRGMPAARLPLERLKTELAAYIVSLPAGVTDKIYSFESAGFRLQVRAVTFSRPAEPHEHSLLGISPGAQWVSLVDDMKKKIKGKLKKYGRLDMPYVIAINRFARFFEKENVVDVLFGKKVESTWTRKSGAYSRVHDGLLWKVAGAQNTRLSAVLAFEQVDAWQVAHRRGMLIENPWSTHKISVSNLALGIDSCVVDKTGIAAQTTGVALGEVFDLAEQINDDS